MKLNKMLLAVLLLASLLATPSFATNDKTPKPCADNAANCSLVAEAPKPLVQVTGWNFDWDDNIMFMPTTIVLFNKITGEEHPVTTSEFAEIRNHIGKPGPWENFEIRGDDPVNGSFRYFRDASGKNFFLEDVIKAITNDPRGKWKGPSWEAFIYALSRPETARFVTIITARGHSPESMMAAISFVRDYLYKKEKIELFLPPLENLYGVSHPKWAGSASNPSETKAHIMIDILDKHDALGDKESMLEVVNREGTAKEKLNLWGFSDDDFGNYAKARDVLAALVKSGRWKNTKITLFFTGKNNPHEKPRSEVIMPDGTVRPMLPDELYEADHIVRFTHCQGELL